MYALLVLLAELLLIVSTFELIKLVVMDINK